MRKILVTLILSLFTIGTASAEIGVNVGISGQLGLFAASATEKDTGSHGTTTGDDETNSDSDFIGLGYASIFIEKELGPLTIGVDYVPDALETETAEQTTTDKTTSATAASVTNKVQVDFSDIRTLYARINLLSGSYFKIGHVSGTIETNETMGTSSQSGSTVGDQDLDGTAYGFGYIWTAENGFQIRAEGMYGDYDTFSVVDTSGDTYTVNKMESLTASLKVAKAF